MRVKSRKTGRRWSGTVWAWRRALNGARDQRERERDPNHRSFVRTIAEQTNGMDRPLYEEVSIALSQEQEQLLEQIIEEDEELDGEIARDD